jgi:hypothetical protein
METLGVRSSSLLRARLSATASTLIPWCGGRFRQRGWVGLNVGLRRIKRTRTGSVERHGKHPSSR